MEKDPWLAGAHPHAENQDPLFGGGLDRAECAEKFVSDDTGDTHGCSEDVILEVSFGKGGTLRHASDVHRGPVLVRSLWSPVLDRDRQSWTNILLDTAVDLLEGKRQIATISERPSSVGASSASRLAVTLAKVNDDKVGETRTVNVVSVMRHGFRPVEAKLEYITRDQFGNGLSEGSMTWQGKYEFEMPKTG